MPQNVECLRLIAVSLPDDMDVRAKTLSRFHDASVGFRYAAEIKMQAFLDNIAQGDGQVPSVDPRLITWR